MMFAQYIIQDINSGLKFQWNGEIVLFDTQEEAEQMIEDCGYYFTNRNPLSVEIKKGIYFIDKSVNYKKICQSGDYIQMTKLYSLSKGGQ